MSFSNLNLHPSIGKALAACGYNDPTPVQAEAIPEILAGKDVVASAQTGTGKTAAFVLPALHLLSNREANKKTRILILTPTRELADQITKAATKYGKFMRYQIVSLVGGMSYHHQIRDLQRGADIIVATPGRLMDHIDNKRVDLSNVEMLVLDEADRMLDMGFIDDVQYIAKLTPSKRQTLLFSATVDKQLATVVKHLLQQPVRIDLSDKVLAAPLIQQEFYRVSNQTQKTKLLKHLIINGNIFKAIVFSATKMHADNLANELRSAGIKAAPLHGDLRQNVRNRTVEDLRRGKVDVIVATDVAARGIDINNVTHVINYDLPRFCEDYVHRIGRTGRAGKEGMAISFVSNIDMKHLQRIEKYIGVRAKLKSCPDLSGDNSYQENPDYQADAKPRRDRREDDGFKSRGQGEKREGGFGKRRSEASEGYAKRRGKSDDAPRSRFSKDDRPKFVGEKSERGERRSFKRDDEAPRSRFAKDDRPKRAGSRAEGGERRSFKRDDEAPRSRFAKDDRPKRTGARAEGGERRSFKRDDEAPRSRFAKDDKPKRAGSRAEGGERRSFKRDDERKPRRDGEGFKKPGRKSDGGKSFAKRSDKPAGGRASAKRGDVKAKGRGEKKSAISTNTTVPTTFARKKRSLQKRAS